MEDLKPVTDVFYNEINAYVENCYEKPECKTTCIMHFQQDLTGLVVPEQIEEVLSKVKKSFSDRLMEIIRIKNLNEVEIYKKADIDRRHFSKIRSNSDYRPTKDTIILLCLSMELPYEETEDLMNRAGLSFSKSDKQDLVAEYFFKNRIYDILLYKSILFKYGFLREPV